MSRSQSRLRLWVIVATTAALVVAGATAGLRYLERRLRVEIIQAIEGTFDGHAELRSLQISLFPSARITGAELILRQRGADAFPPLVSLDAFVVDAGLSGLQARRKAQGRERADRSLRGDTVGFSKPTASASRTWRCDRSHPAACRRSSMIAAPSIGVDHTVS